MFRQILRIYSFRSHQYRYTCKSTSAASKPEVQKVRFEDSVEIKTIDKNTLDLLEQLSLVDCTGDNAVKVLTDAINFASKIHSINTDGVEPMYTVLENRYLTLRNDEVTQGNCQKDILKNATVVEEDYFVAPPGNIPLPPKE